MLSENENCERVKNEQRESIRGKPTSKTINLYQRDLLHVYCLCGFVHVNFLYIGNKQQQEWSYESQLVKLNLYILCEYICPDQTYTGLKYKTEFAKIPHVNPCDVHIGLCVVFNFTKQNTDQD